MKKIRLETIIYLGILILAGVLRFWGLADVPISEMEAANGLKAMRMANGVAESFDGHAGYLLFTSVLFYFFEANDFLLRFWPALIGSFFVLSPMFFRRHLASGAALLVAAWLALDPGSIYLSRTASGDMLSLAFFIFFAGALLQPREIAAGIFLSLALLSGAGVWYILFPTVLILGLYEYLFLRREQGAEAQSIMTYLCFGIAWRKFAFSFTIGLFLFSTLFLFNPEGINGIFSGLVNYFSGWSQPAIFSLKQVFGSLAVHETLPLVLGLIAISFFLIKPVRSDQLLVGWFGIALLLLIFYPARSALHVVLVTLPLMVLAARKAVGIAKTWHIEPYPFWGMLLLMLVATVYAVLNLKSLITESFGDTLTYQLRIAGILAAIFLIPLVVALVTWGWSLQTAIKGFLIGLTFGLLILNTNSLSTVVRPDLSKERLLFSHPVFPDRDLIAETVSDMYLWATSDSEKLIVMNDIESDALIWSLRDKSIIDTLSLMNASTPGFVFTEEDEQLTLGEQYTGQSFTLSRRYLWEDLRLSDWLRWIFGEQAPFEDDMIILWVGSDLFPGYENNDNNQ